jgi:UDP-N-acetylmuramate--alanine ligase
MGIGGSGMSAVAQIAQAYGYLVSGCDLQTDTYYLENLKKLGVEISSGHNPTHLQNIDLLAVTPAAFYQSASHPELTEAKAKGILLTWQQFLGQYLQQNKFLICIAGTHGKSTTTALAGLLLEQAGLDPTVEIGATVKEWHNNVRISHSKYFISEADEFHDNYLAYHPNIIILNNIEMDHPEYFVTMDKLLASFKNFISQMASPAILIYNNDSLGNRQLIAQIDPAAVQLVPYSLSDCPTITPSPYDTSFTYQDYKFTLSLPGLHNVANSLGLIQLAKQLGIPFATVNSVLKNFQGLGRRMDEIGSAKNVHVVDDYAVHPTAMAATIAAARQKYPGNRIWAIIEPHTYSRNRALLNLYPAALSDADFVIVSQIFGGRELDPGDFSGQDIVSALHHPAASYIPGFEEITEFIKNRVHPNDVILVMGAGLSYQLSRSILAAL